ncbi:hypothetical protein [Ovoidimarina sediminis]|uniref:hypothetical protein n=1 Tax=Ovoidimarina sediminis TaxID=3079856 RepID=UPI002906B8DE|nr:hypothetical protein [Rhodophyticola sp. MJ-SS7]MDU8943696.1 hypothetical protein [Rhodophyticola sp. MJ-SS7]
MPDSLPTLVAIFGMGEAMSSNLKQIRRAFDWLPSWVPTAFGVAVFYALITYDNLAADWVHAHPSAFVALIGVASYLLFFGTFAWDLRYGQDAFAEVRARIRSNISEPNEPTVGLWIILGLLILTIVAVIVAALFYAQPRGETRPMLIIILGGLTAGAGAPFLIPPTVFVAGLLSPASCFTVTFTTRLATPCPDALTRRAALEKRPQPQGLTALRPMGDGRFRADAVYLGAMLMRHGTDYTLTRGSDGSLAIASQTDAGDREVAQLTQTGPQEIETEVEVSCNGAWTRGFLRLAGISGYARLVAEVEEAVLATMLGTDAVRGNLHV